MKLLLAVGFDNESTDALYKHMQSFFKKCNNGVFTKKENVNFTLLLFSENARIGQILEVLDDIKIEKIRLELSDKGKFKCTGGDVCFLGIKAKRELMHFYKMIRSSFVDKGVELEKLEFTPNIVVSRLTSIKKEKIPQDVFDEKITVCRLSLLKYENTNDGVHYTEVYAKSF